MHRKPFLILSLFLMIGGKVLAQEILFWNDLTDVQYHEEYNEDYQVNFLVPTFGEYIKSFEGKRVSIKGFYIDIAGDGEILLLSQNPMAACFFCGGSGPETVIEVNFRRKPAYRTDQIVQITGILELNASDVDKCNYILNDATGKLVN